MKKILSTLVLLMSLSSFAGTFTIYNYTAYNFAYQINTRPTSVSATYPTLNSTATLLVLSSGNSVVYSAASGFPFNSPSSVPVVSSWLRKTSATSGYIATSNTVAQSVFGASQQFAFLKYTFSGIPFSGNLGPYGDSTSQSYNNGAVNLESFAIDGEAVVLAT